ncbi:L-rhamnose mutarotase [Microbacterium oxydans]|uniref:L-rhamnose mutarotase n=1 Tax=Microbacterium oxydans TaxID=82380 RepID=UPI0022B20EE5|nr:L-rhamnose mutarotase [Microbacterium oxydans]MCZ4299835.1 L-rhamnose mutarotase [Microbacterium oxydans]
MRIALHSVIAEGAIEDYRSHHARIPDSLRDLFDVAGIHDWTIWRSGRNLFHLVECDDFEATMRIVEASPANDSWQADIGRFVEGFHGPDGQEGFTPIERVWALAAQRATGS